LPHPKVAIHLNVDDVLITAGEKDYPVKGRELVLKLPVGTYRLTARKPGYIPAEQKISIETQDIELPINLEEIQYRLSVTSNTENSSVSVSCATGRKYSGLASPDKPFQVKTSAQSCTVLAEKQGYQHISKEVSLTADQKLSLTLKRLFQVTVYTNLDLSTVMLDGKEAGKAGSKTPATLSIPGGNYLITVSNPQAAAPVERKLLVEKDQRLTVDLPLPKLTVKVNKAGTILVVDGKEHRVSGKELTLELPQGMHHITAKKEGYAVLQREMPVRDGAQTFFELLPPSHPLSVRSNIDKTAVHVRCKDGEEYSGLASPQEPFLFQAAAGTCTVSASREGYQEVSKPAALPTEKEITFNLIPEEEIRNQLPENKKEHKEQPVVQVEQPAVQSEAEKNEPVPVEQPAEQPEAEKNEPAPVEQSAEQPESEEQDPAVIEIRPGKVKVKPESVQQGGKTKDKPAPPRSKAEKTKKKNKKKRSVVQSATQPET
ncbi:MAG: PEGA domain-containing protein, partial [Candidatus Electrothrix sp. AUS1_2]|nr:PEGA domain-containing protein [Candidatus Electrothrix sp. AUS1_2]